MAATRNIFISYRREDAADVAGRIRDWLIRSGRVPQEHIFLDVATILPGADFQQVIDTSVGRCKAIIVVISPSWLAQVNVPGQSNLRLEIEAALRHQLLVVPVLVGGAHLPHAEELPESLRTLVHYNARPVRAESFDYDMGWVRRGLGIRRGLAVGWIATIGAFALVLLGAGVLSQVPQGNPVYEVFHAPAATPTATNTATPTATATPTPTPGPTGQLVVLDDTDPHITYIGDWITLQDPSSGVYYNATAHTTTQGGASFSYTFKGTAITLITTMGVDYGHTSFYIDGAVVTNQNFNAPSQENQQAVAIAAGLAYGTHTLQGVVIDGRLTVDALKVSE